MPLIRDNRAEAERVLREAFARNRVAWTQTDDLPVGTPEDVAELLAPYIELDTAISSAASLPRMTRSR